MGWNRAPQKVRDCLGTKVMALCLALTVAGCAAVVTPEGTYIEPIGTIVVGPPGVIIEAPPPHIVVPPPLPPVVLIPRRHVYFYSGFYYYYWDGAWFYSDRDRGPWYRLPRRHYPPRYYRR